MIGERTNVTGSARSARSSRPATWRGRRGRASAGAERRHALDVNMDADLLDGERAMAALPQPARDRARGARLPIVVDSSRRSVIEAGLMPPGQGVVNSISLKEGEQPFLEHARTIRRYGAAVVVMAFDEQDSGDGRLEGRDLRTRVPPADRAQGSRPRTSSSTRTCWPSRRGSRSTTSSRGRSSSPCPDQGALPGRTDERRHLEPVSPSAGTSTYGRRCTRPSSTTRSAPASTWGSSMRVS